jgi:hypothetical protein
MTGLELHLIQHCQRVSTLLLDPTVHHTRASQGVNNTAAVLNLVLPRRYDAVVYISFVTFVYMTV